MLRKKLLQFSTFLKVLLVLFFSFLQPFSIKAKNKNATIAVIVNNDVITHEDIRRRAALILFSSGDANKEIPEAVKQQVQEALIQEKLQRQIAKRVKITVAPEELAVALENIARENNMSTDQMKTLFLNKGVDIRTLRERLESGILWIKCVRAVFAGNIRISDRELEEEKRRLIANESKEQIHLAELVLFVDKPENQGKVRSEINNIYQTLKAGTPFLSAARNFSQAPSGAQGGLIGWISIDQAPPTAAKLKVGEFSEPVIHGNRYVIYYCKDHKLPGQAASSESRITYMSAEFKIPEDAGDVVPENLIQFAEAAKEVKSCRSFKQLVHNTADAKFNETRDVPKISLHEDLLKIFAGQKRETVSPPVRLSQTDVILCDQKAPAKKSLPSDEDLKLALMEKRVQEQAITQFNKIKSTSIIEYRNNR
jgi:peptidyl-prolyl cis-trans isomerase SurA